MDQFSPSHLDSTKNLLSLILSTMGVPEFYQDYLLALIVVVLVFIGARVVKTRLQKYFLSFTTKSQAISQQRLFKTFADMVSEIRDFSLFALSLYVALQVLDLPSAVDRFFDRSILLLVLLQIGLWGNRLIAHYLEIWSEAKTEQDPSQKALLGLLNYFARMLFWLLLCLIALNNIGVDITALVAGVGIGGIAIALAVQNILGDALASLTIALDKPFVVGDAIQVDDLIGTIEQVSLKNTRIRSQTGELVIVANNDLLKSRIRNWKKMDHRRVLLRIDVTYQTSPDMLRKVGDMVREVVQSVPEAQFDYVFLKNLGETNFQYELVYYVLSPDVRVYARVHQEILVLILERFKAAGVHIPSPTYTVISQTPKE